MRNKPYRVTRRPKHAPMWPVLIMLVSAMALALVISGAWQVAEGKPFFPPSTDMFPAVSSSSQDAPSSSEPEDVPESRGGDLDSSSSESDSSSAPDPKIEQPVFEGAVPETEPVEQNYFNDAVFVGDSITEGMTVYGGMENARVLAGRGINFSTIHKSEVVKLADGSQTTIMDELAKEQYGKVYVMLGGNEVRDMSLEAFLSRYETVLDEIRALQPEAFLYVQSMTPVTANNLYKMDNKRIDEFNQAILEMCLRKGFYYLNVAECLKDSTGMLPTEASPKDGMHFARPYFDKWYDYLKRHAIPTGKPPAPLRLEEPAASSDAGETAPSSSETSMQGENTLQSSPALSEAQPS